MFPTRMEQLTRLKTALADRYTIQVELGEGGMATVYRAHDLKHDRQVALKVMRPEVALALGPDRFLREIAIAAQLHNPHILTLIDSGDANGVLYYVMPLVEGETLATRLQRENQLPLEEALQLILEVASALRYAHGRGVVHRDIKPANIMLTGGHAVVMDFGIGRMAGAPGAEKLTRTGLILGTPAYMSPEQASGEADARADIYAVGCVLYEMLAGTPPFDGPTAQSILVRHAVDPVPSLRATRPDISAELDAVIRQAMAKHPADRFADMSQFQERLREAQKSAGSTASPAQTTWQGGKVPSIAVLPFTNLSADPEQDYFCEGIAEEITNALVRSGGMRVTALSVVRRYADSAAEGRDAGRELGVDLVLEGSVRKAGNRLRITARLTAIPDGIHLWSERYDRTVDDVFAIQDEITHAIIAALSARLSMAQPAGRERPIARPTANLDAYDAYLRGIHAFNKRSPESNQRAIALLEQATTLDPGFAVGFAALAGAYVEQFFTHDPDESWEEKAFVAIEKARTLDPGLAEIYVAKGNLLWTRAHRFPHREAITEYRRALAINPQLAAAYNELARVYWHIGLLDPALDALERAMKIDPAFVDAEYRLGWLEMHRGNYQRALGLLGRVPAGSLAPGVDVLTALTLLYLERGDEARARLSQIEERHRTNPDLTSVEAIFLALDGRTEEAEERIASAQRTGRHLGHFHHVGNNIADAFALMNRPDQALEWLRYTANEGFPCYPWFARDPCLLNLRRDLRFAALLRDLQAEWSTVT